MSKRKQHHPVSANGFRSLGLSDEIYHGISKLGFRTPTPVQRKALPVILTGVDAVVMARTGSGKTAAFLIPLVEKLLHSPTAATIKDTNRGVRGVILSPTRELSQQTLRVLHKLCPIEQLKSIGIHGGETMERQFSLLASRPDVIVATPGRLAHHVTEIPDFNLNSVQMLILDEADRLLEQGLAAQIRQIAQSMPRTTQKVLLSATLPKILVEFTKTGFCVDPAVVRLDAEATVSQDLRMAFCTCRSADKDAALLHVLRRLGACGPLTSSGSGLTLIFAATRHHVEYICTLLQASGMEDVTMIYGSMDQHARQHNLQLFRKGTTPVLVVTDVAARGLDVPLIDHVIHYHFAPSPKLFVHRSGRAARAGRTGYCWSLVEPDEIPYMMDLHLFLGRKPETSATPYSLSNMTPDMVHYGSVPESITEVETVARLLHSELTGSDRAESLRSLTQVCKNAMQQYRKTRPEASREAVRRAKAVLEGRRLATGQRVDHVTIPTHPLLLDVAGTPPLETERQAFLQAVSSFRPKETVFETNVQRSSKDVVSHIDKGRTTTVKSATTAIETSLVAMQQMRRQMRMVRDRGMVVAGSAATTTETEHEETVQQNADVPADSNISSTNRLPPYTEQVEGKRRLSKAERKRLKKSPHSLAAVAPTQIPTKATASFRDPQHFIDHAVESDRSRRVEAAMHASGNNSRAVRMEEAMLDIVGDENEQLVKKQRMMRWDKAKRKYVQTTVGEELRGDSKTKKLRLESGQLVRGDKLKLGELYQKWQKKTNRSVGRSGVFDDAGDVPETKANPRQAKTGRKQQGHCNNELKTSKEIKKEREKKQQLKIKNMNRSERRKLNASATSGKVQVGSGGPGGKKAKKKR